MLVGWCFNGGAGSVSVTMSFDLNVMSSYPVKAFVVIIVTKVVTL